MKIQAKLFVFAILCAILPLIGAFVLSFSTAEKSLSETAEHNLQAHAREELANLQRSLADAKHELITLGKLSNMQNVRFADYAGFLQNDLDIFAERTPLFAEIIAADSTGLAIAGTLKNFVQKDLSGTWEFEAPKLGINFDGPVVKSYRLNRHIATQSIPLYNSGVPDSIIGALIGSIDWKYLEKNLSDQTLFGGEQSKKRRVILESTADGSILYSTAGFPVPTELLTSATDESTIRRVTLEGQDYLMVSASSKPINEFRDPRWRLHLLLDTDIVYASVISLQRHFILAGAAVLILVLLLGFIVTRTIVNPVKSLLTGAERLAQGDYDYPLKITNARDEISQLTRSFDAMRSSIQKNERQLRKKTKQAEKAARLKSEFVANMSHEVRTPINGVLGMTELLLNTELNSTQIRYADSISRSGHSLLSVINDILDFSKIEAGKLELAEGAFDLRDLLEDVVQLLAKGAHKKGVEIGLHIAPNQHLAYNGDASRLRQVLTNLIGNAIKFTNEGEIQVHVETKKINADRSLALFKVVDTGIGIAEEKQDAIFESFVQADGTTTRQFGGSGLGLAISSRLATLMGGTIGVNSVLGEGSTFWFTASITQLSSNIEEAWSGDDALVGKRVLIVDDNQTNREILETQVDFWGATPYLACGGEEALHEIEVATQTGQAFDVAILDLHMPGMSGMELAVQVHQRGLAPDTRLIMLSSACDQLDLHTCRSIGINSMITKPVRQPDLYNCLTAAVNCTGCLQLTDRQVAVEIPTNTLKGNVLLAEDNPVNQEMMMEMLKLLGVTAVLAEDGQQALDAIQNQEFNVVLMDCQMPVLDGFAATRKIREDEQSDPGRKHLPIVALTANALQGDRERCLQSGMDEYLSKPVTSQQLKTMLSQWLGNTYSTASADSKIISVDQTATPSVAGDVETNLVPAAITSVVEEEQEPIIDETIFAEVWAMCQQASPEFYANLVAKYEQGSQEDVETLADAIADDNAEVVSTHAHRLKSSSANWGGRRVANTCQALESAAKAHSLENAPVLLRQLIDDHVILLTELKLRESRAA